MVLLSDDRSFLVRWTTIRPKRHRVKNEVSKPNRRRTTKMFMHLLEYTLTFTKQRSGHLCIWRWDLGLVRVGAWCILCLVRIASVHVGLLLDVQLVLLLMYSRYIVVYQNVYSHMHWPECIVSSVSVRYRLRCL